MIFDPWDQGGVELYPVFSLVKVDWTDALFRSGREHFHGANLGNLTQQCETAHLLTLTVAINTPTVANIRPTVANITPSTEKNHWQKEDIELQLGHYPSSLRYGKIRRLEREERGIGVSFWDMRGRRVPLSVFHSQNYKHCSLFESSRLKTITEHHHYRDHIIIVILIVMLVQFKISNRLILPLLLLSLFLGMAHKRCFYN